MNFMKTSSANATQYESVEDSKDLRIPVQSEEAFEHGINFKCKVSDTIIILILHTILYLTHLSFIMNMRLSKYVYLPSFVKISNFWALREFLQRNFFFTQIIIGQRKLHVSDWFFAMDYIFNNAFSLMNRVVLTRASIIF